MRMSLLLVLVWADRATREAIEAGSLSVLKCLKFVALQVFLVAVCLRRRCLQGDAESGCTACRGEVIAFGIVIQAYRRGDGRIL
jgi:hypothetical protein